MLHTARKILYLLTYLLTYLLSYLHLLILSKIRPDSTVYCTYRMYLHNLPSSNLHDYKNQDTLCLCFLVIDFYRAVFVPKNGWTPLHWAAKAGHLPVVRLLVESGAGPKHETVDNKMPISLAASASHTDRKSVV